MGTAPVVAQQSSVPQLSHTTTDAQSLIGELANSLSVLDATLHQQIEMASQQEDLDTADLLNEVSRDVSKALWFLEAHLQPQHQGGNAGQAPDLTQQQGTVRIQQ
jgi:starvation-inducible DNA-binding protein